MGTDSDAIVAEAVVSHLGLIDRLYNGIESSSC